MLSKRLFLLPVIVMAASLLLGACDWSARRNDDGSWTVTGKVSQSEAQQTIDQALDDPLIKSLQADFQSGAIAVSADRQSVDGSRTQVLTFRAVLGVVNGHLGVTVTDAALDGVPVDAGLVAVWNERIATRLERAGRRDDGTTLESVSVTDDELTMVWHAEGRNNRQ